MDLVVDQVVELEVIHVADGDRVVEQLARAPVVQPGLAVPRQPRLLEAVGDIVLVRAVEDGGHDLPAKLGRRAPEMDLEHLADVHAARDAQGV